ncbi:uncharacterized protein LOC124933683 [Impatiens glandulifera]|uniref:uncharacterized protein LOC124933683 n=1 Tax=Impatiens glandulifera TaxID=253017 RepID=UPI001FB15E4E|nr:uncharacterized protein LOC124933683 [Impatiens glandulifera]
MMMMMELSSRTSARTSSIMVDEYYDDKDVVDDDSIIITSTSPSLELEIPLDPVVGRSHDHDHEHEHEFRSMNALEILRETVRILRFNFMGFIGITVLLICPVTAIILSNVLVDSSVARRLSIRLLLLAQSSGLPIRHFIKQSCYKFAETSISSVVCFPLNLTLSLLSKAAVVYSVDCAYYRKKFDSLKFYLIMAKIWRRLASTYLWVCMVISGCLTSFIILLVAVCSLFSAVGFGADAVVYVSIGLGLIFSIVFANALIIGSIAVVISVLEDVSGPEALHGASLLIRGQTQVGLLIFLGSTMGMAFVEGLFEHRVKTLSSSSFDAASSRIWEAPLLAVMYSFVVLVDYMNNAVFYFSCKSYRMENSPTGECRHSSLEAMAISSPFSDSEQH